MAGEGGALGPVPIKSHHKVNCLIYQLNLILFSYCGLFFFFFLPMSVGLEMQRTQYKEHLWKVSREGEQNSDRESVSSGAGEMLAPASWF